MRGSDAFTSERHKRMRTFRIGYKSFYRETSDHHSDYIHAENESAALEVFAKRHKIPTESTLPPDKWTWWDSEWLCEFRAIESVNVLPCPHCDGNGEIAVSQPALLT